jgi:tRNA threonylcarbamoyladenosine biosynthesis protein TsaB
VSLILSLETATVQGSVALHQKSQLVALFDILLENSHSQTLTIQIEQLMRLSGFSLAQLDAIAVSAGPGSYTGLRIGTSTAKGLCFALDKPLIAVDTLQAMAAIVADTAVFPEALLCPMLDARRMEAWCGIYKGNETVWAAAPRVIEANSFDEFTENQMLILFGNGANKYQNILEARRNIVFWQNVVPSAKYVGYLATKQWEQGQTADLAYFEPYYLKEGNATAKPLASRACLEPKSLFNSSCVVSKK